MSERNGQLPNSKKIHVSGKLHPDIRVPFRESSLASTKSMNGEIEINEPVRVYDTSGPHGVDVREGLPKVRAPWVARRRGSDAITQLQFARRGVVTEEMAKIAKVIEPKLREGLARSMARRFDARQLADINAFLATDSGRAFGSQSMSMWVDPDLMRAMMGTFPEIMQAMPAAMKRLETETAHLPKPKKKVEAKEVEADKDDEE